MTDWKRDLSICSRLMGAEGAATAAGAAMATGSEGAGTVTTAGAGVVATTTGAGVVSAKATRPLTGDAASALTVGRLATLAGTSGARAGETPRDRGAVAGAAGVVFSLSDLRS